MEIRKKITGFIAGLFATPTGQKLVRALVLVLIAVDQLLNVLSNPFSDETWADETLSSRCGRLEHRNPYKFWSRVINFIFYPFQGPNHCRNAYEKERSGYHFPPEMRHNATASKNDVTKL